MSTRSGTSYQAAAMAAAAADLEATIAALQAENARLRAQTAAADAAAGSAREQPQVRLLSAAENVPILAKFEDIKQQEDNPVQRGHLAPPTISRLDLSIEPGMVRARTAGPAIQREYEVIAAALSYSWDALAVMQQQCSAVDIPEDRRKSLSVVVSAVEQVVQFLHERRDLLVTKGEFKNDPNLVKAVEMSLGGTDGLPISSTRVQQVLKSATTAQVGYLQKQSAKQQVVAPSQNP